MPGGRAPAQVTGASLAQVSVREEREAAGAVRPRRELVRQALDGQTAGSPPLAAFHNLKPGEYTVAVMSMGQHAEELEPPSDTSATVPGGGLKQVVLEVGPTAWIEIVLVGEDDKPIPGERYRIKLPDGAIKEGELDAEGCARCEGIARGQCQVTFPDLDKDAWERI